MKEEIKQFFEDFDEDVRDNVIDYTQFHRYECLMDSEDEAGGDDSDSDNEDDEVIVEVMNAIQLD